MDTFRTALERALSDHTGRVIRDALAVVSRDVHAVFAPRRTRPATSARVKPPSTTGNPPDAAGPPRPTATCPSSPDAVARAVERVRKGATVATAMREEGVSYNKLARAMRRANVKSRHGFPFRTKGTPWIDAMTEAHETGG